MLEKEHSYFSADGWMLHSYQKCKEMISRTSERLLATHENVILDFGFWTRTERKDVRHRFQANGHRVTVSYFPIAVNTQLLHMEMRQNSGMEKHYTLDRETMAALNGRFEEPDDDEDPVSVGEFDPWKPGA